MHRPVELQAYPLTLPFRTGFGHARATRQSTQTLVLLLRLDDGTIGTGEGLPRLYVTGETIDSALTAVFDTIAPLLHGFSPNRFADVIDFADNLPTHDRLGRCIHAARAAVELALLDAYAKAFNADLSCLLRWLGYAPFASGGTIHRTRVTGVLGTSPPKNMRRRLALMRTFGLRDFKVKLGTERDDDTIHTLDHAIGPAVRNRKLSLRADANGAWDVDHAADAAGQLAALGYACLEQPLAPEDRNHWPILAEISPIALMVDESLITIDDAHWFAANDLADAFNIRISKNGGLIQALRIAQIAHRHNRTIVLGAMVGESAILASAGLRFLQLVPGVQATEIGYSSFLLKRDLAPARRFGFRGRLPTPTGRGLALNIPVQTLLQFANRGPIVHPFY